VNVRDHIKYGKPSPMKKAKIGPTFVRKMGQFLKRIAEENDLNKNVCVASKINCR
jgi:hypothetical protein